MPEVGVDGQRKLKAAKVLCIGAGGLGSPVAMYLAAAGVGTLGLVDFDVVDFSNLQRQILHGTPDVGRSKLASARDRLQRAQPGSRRSTRTRRRSRRRTRSSCSSRTTSSSTAPTTSRRAISSTTRACCSASRTSTAASSASRAGVGVRDEGRPVLPLPLSRAAAARTRAELRRRRRPRRAAGHHRHDPGDRGDQADPRHRRAADRPVPDLRRAADALPRAQAAEGSRLPGVRHASDGDAS